MMTDSLAPFTLSTEEQEWMHSLYQELHRNPELSMQEHRTQERIEEQLDALGIEHVRCGGTGVVGLVRNGEQTEGGHVWPSPVVAFRADTDGLPIAEETGLPYASQATGTLPEGTHVPVMHGCGHDTHMTALLAAARLLLRERHRWSGTLVLIFQPGEEIAAGARAMVEDGLWERAPHPEIVLGQHVSPGRAGTVALTRGPAMAMADSLKVTVHGRQTHGAQPQHGIDPVVTAAAMVTRLQSVVSREVSPLASAVVTVATFHAGLKENIIPEQAEFTINVRSLTQEVREKVLSGITRIVRAEASAAGAPEPTVEKLYDFPMNFNHEDRSEQVLSALRAGLGEENVLISPPAMVSEDFGWLGEAIGVPTVFWWFGGTEDGDPDGPTNHSPQFAPVIEPTLETGTRAALAALLHWLGR